MFITLKQLTYMLASIILTTNMVAQTQKTTSQQIPTKICWDNQLIIPPDSGQEANPGLAGVYSGVSNNHLLIAGGANFPKGMPWDGGQKKWWRTIYSFPLNSNNPSWQVFENALPYPMAYGVSVQLPQGILCIGGNDADQCYSDVFMISQTPEGIAISYDWPSLPVPLSNCSGTYLNGKIYIAGGQESMQQASASNHFFMLDLAHKEYKWQKLASWPGSARGYAVFTADSANIYLIGGRNYINNQITEVLTDGYVYNQKRNEWSLMKGKFPVMAGTAIIIDEQFLLFIGGVSRLLPTNDCHPGFDNILRYYNIKEQRMVKEEIIPYSIPVTTNMVYKDQTLYITSGEIRPGVRTPNILRGKIYK